MARKSASDHSVTASSLPRWGNNKNGWKVAFDDELKLEEAVARLVKVIRFGLHGDKGSREIEEFLPRACIPVRRPG